MTVDPTSTFFNFKVGLYDGVQLMLLLINVNCLLKPRIGKIPFVIQLIWTVNCLVWNQTFHLENDEAKKGLYITSAFLDIFTKSIVIYFLSIRILVVGNLFKAKRMSWSLIFMFGVITSIIGNFNGFLITEDTPEHVVLALNACYYSNDVFISIVEITTVYIYLKVKYHLRTVHEFVGCLKELGLKSVSFLIFGFAVINLLTFILNICIPEFDPDLNFNGILAAIKYHYACQLTVELFHKTMGNTVEASQRASNPQGYQKPVPSVPQTPLPLRKVPLKTCQMDPEEANV